MPPFNNVMIITEDQVGEGSPLLFPSVSSCSAVVACLANTLVGAHFTQDVWTGVDPQKFTRRLLDGLKDKIGVRPIDRLLIVGFNQGHNPPKIMSDLEVPPAHCDTYDISRKGVPDVTLIFTHQGAGVRPKVDFKRQTKVTAAADPNPDWTMADLRKGALGTATTGKLHTLRKHFV
ncbi:hypothetical protein [Variovorax sp. dw_954]|uniref:hypothetical protein n=1 Tax=Variovorax sp. dw_954 TaxID=2720078 RepID=UPI001BD27A70|nr:hypothetical protein [Variovorax sp. dw_954]